MRRAAPGAGSRTGPRIARGIEGPTDHVVVVGAGLAGLSAALHLLGAGRRVTLLERAGHPGGLAGRLDLRTERGSYLVDPGPTVLTMPHLLDEALAAVGERLSDRLDLVPLDPAYRAHFADGSTLDVRPGAADMAAEVERVCGADAVGGYLRLREWLERLYRAEIDTFIGANHDSPLGLLGADLLRLAALGGFAGLGGQVGRFVADERLRRLFTFQALYAGVPPARALGAYGVIAYMDTVAGVSFPRGGMRAIGAALAAAATTAGAELHLGRTATGLRREHGRVTGVRHRATSDGTTSDGAADHRGGDTALVDCDAVVLATDLDQAYRLIGRAPRRPVRLRRSPSAVVLHLGLRTPRPELAHHTISFGAAWETTFREIIDRGMPMSDPSLLVTRPTATDPTLAPAGGDLLFVLAPCPNLDAGPMDWKRMAPYYRDEMLATLAARDHPGLADLAGDVDIERIVTPRDWAAAGLAGGTPFALAHTLAQTGPFRPSNLVASLHNAVLAGCGTTPGVGIPPVIISGRLAAARVTGVTAGRG